MAVACIAVATTQVRKAKRTHVRPRSIAGTKAPQRELDAAAEHRAQREHEHVAGLAPHRQQRTARVAVA